MNYLADFEIIHMMILWWPAMKKAQIKLVGPKKWQEEATAV